MHRSEGDFEWLQSALEEACPERIIPPMVSHSSLHGKPFKDRKFKLYGSYIAYIPVLLLVVTV